MMTCEPTSLTSLFILLIFWSVSSVLLWWWPTSFINQGKEADKLLRTSTYSSNAQGFLWCSVVRNPDITIYHIYSWLDVLTIKLTAKTIKYEWSKLCMLRYVLEKFLPIWTEQGPWLIWTTWPSVHFLICPFGVKSLLHPPAGRINSVCSHVSHIQPCKCFSICHLPGITGIIIFYLLIWRGKLCFGLLCCVVFQLSSCHCFQQWEYWISKDLGWCFQGQKDLGA